MVISPIFAAYNIVEFAISCKNDETKIKIYTDNVPIVRDSVLTNPDRLVLTFKGGINQFKTNEYNVLPGGLVLSVRINQISSGPDYLTQVIMDIADSPGNYKKEKNDDGFTLSIETAGYPEIETHKSGRKANIPKPPTEPQKEIEKPKQTKKPIETPPAETKDTTKSTTEKTSTPKAEASKPATGKPVSKPSSDKAAKTPPTQSNDSLKTQQSKTDSAIPEDFEEPTSDDEDIEDSIIRDNIVYERPVERDPFIKVDNAQKVTIGEYSRPGIEGVSLVGVIGSAGDYIALLQNGKGFGYMLEMGDSVQNGIVVAVSDSSIIFRIDDYGYIRDVKMPLKRKIK